MSNLLKTANEIRLSMTEAITSRNVTLLSNIILSVALLMIAVRFWTFEPGAVAIPDAAVTSPLEVKGNWASASFKMGHAIAFAELLGNVNGNNVKFVKERFLSRATPYLRDQFEDEIDRQIAIIQARKMKQTFMMEDSYYDDTQDIVWIWGNRTITLPNQDPLHDIWTYEMRIGVENGMPRLMYFQQYAGKPNTKQKKVTPASEVPTLSEDMKQGLQESGSKVEEGKTK
jgi:conjugal transfer pilus assembly protein TraE